MAKVYLENSYVSACVSKRNDPASIYRRQISREWWDSQAMRHDLFISAEVITELSDPNYPQRNEAMDWVEQVPLLEITPEVRGLAGLMVREKVMPAPIAGDAVHVAVACVHTMEYLLSWNVRHLANPNKLAHLRVVCLKVGLMPPQIVTPDMLWEEKP